MLGVNINDDKRVMLLLIIYTVNYQINTYHRLNSEMTGYNDYINIQLFVLYINMQCLIIRANVKIIIKNKQKKKKH